MRARLPALFIRVVMRPQDAVCHLGLGDKRDYGFCLGLILSSSVSLRFLVVEETSCHLKHLQGEIQLAKNEGLPITMK